jgi:cytochrome c-type biogenesis protein CcmH/NrfG
MTFRFVSSLSRHLLSLSLLAGLLPFLFTAIAVNAQSDAYSGLPLPQRIHDQLALLHMREQAKASAHELGYRWALLGAEYTTAGDFANSESSYNHSLQLLSTDSSSTTLYADVFDLM